MRGHRALLMIKGLQHQSAKNFRNRSKWLQLLLDQSLDIPDSEISDLNLGPQAEGLLFSAMSAFCSAGWISVTILCQAALDAALWENHKFEGIERNKITTGRDYIWLRNKRNALLHVDQSGPAITIHSYAVDDASMERDAKRSMQLAIKGLADFLR